MKSKYKKRAHIGILSGIIIPSLPLLIPLLLKGSLRENLFLLIDIVMITSMIGYILIAWGCYNLAKAKGYSGRFGAMLGLLNFLGLIYLIILPDEHNKKQSLNG